jgi:quinol monooxygenase YgiN
MNNRVDAPSPAAEIAHDLYAITVAFELKPGERDAFLALVRANAVVSLRDEADCLRFDVLIPLAQGQAEVLLYEIYADRRAFDAHLASAHFLQFDTATRAMVAKKTIAEFSTRDTVATE